MKRPPLAAVSVPRSIPGYALASIGGWAGEAQSTLKAISDRQAMHASAINQMVEGQGINRGVVTLRSGETTTTVEGTFIPAGAGVLLTARTLNAAAALATTYVPATTKGQFVITHANNGQTDKTFTWQLVVAD